ncbi:MAG: hypothetical protein SGILL_009366 [Bacillariaceae sp.]
MMCTLEMTPPGRRTISVVFSRTQLQSAQAIKTDSNGNYLQVDTEKYEPPKRGQKGKKYSYNKKGPDEKGRYRSYRIKFHETSPEGHDENNEEVEDGDFSPLKEWLIKDEEDGMYFMHFRHFGLTQSRTRVRANVNKVESYVKRRRQKLLIKENATLPWQGILCLIFGLMGFLLTLLVGQLWDETPKRHGGPGTRRSSAAARSSATSRSSVGSARKSKPSFVYDSGRPSKIPQGYGGYSKKY